MMEFESPLVLWFHSVNNTKWDISSYKNISTMNNFVEFSSILKSIEHKIFPNSMFFIMKKGIEPTWEDPKNRVGGTWSFKINDDSILDVWWHINSLLISDSLFKEDTIVNGLSVAPKKGYYILKVWCGEKGDTHSFSKELENIGKEFNKNSSQYKSHH